MTLLAKLTLPTLILWFCLALATVAHGAPKAELWPLWQGSDAQSLRRVDHSAWAQFLDQYLVTELSGAANRLRYAAVSAADRSTLNAYLQMLGAVPVVNLNRAQQLAFWINLYNALTVRTILEHFPLESIRDIKSGWFSPGPWDLKLIEVNGTELSLNDIEHRILRPIWQDQRIHYAVNCASLGCPNLQPQPFTAENSAELLERAAREYVNSPRGVSFEGNRLMLSSIYDWYRDDFGTSDEELLGNLARFAAPALAARLQGFRGAIGYSYDWRLNAAP